MAKVKQEHQQAVTTKERQIVKLREEIEQQSRGGANDEVTTLKAQIQVSGCGFILFWRFGFN